MPVITMAEALEYIISICLEELVWLIKCHTVYFSLVSVEGLFLLHDEIIIKVRILVSLYIVLILN